MYTVSEMMGVSKRNGRGLVIYLPTAVGRTTESGRTFEKMLGTLGRSLRKTGGVVVAFEGDEDNVTADVLKKTWDSAERATISRRPGLLIIDKSFDDFDPQSDNWFHIDLRELYNSAGTLNERLAEELVTSLYDIFLSEEDMFYLLRDRQIVARRDRALAAVSIKPSWLGCGVDVGQLVRAFRR
jgi:hypothetical protein